MKEKLKSNLNSKERKKMQKGITLVALVVTIVVLLILAGVTISTLTGENGIIKTAKNAKEETTIEQEKEQVEIAYASAVINKLGEDVTATDLQNELNNSVGKNRAKVTGSTILKVHFNDTENEYQVENGKVTKYEKMDPTAVYAKLYTDGTLILSSYDYTDETREVSEDYGDVSNKTDYYQQTNAEPILIGDYPGWINEKAYYPSNENITKVIIYDYIAPKKTASWFAGLGKLTSIEGIEKLNLNNVEDVSNMFTYCISLSSLDVKNFDTRNIRDMSKMFSFCRLAEIDVSNFDTSNVTNMSEMFYGCSSLKSLDVSNFDTSNVTNMSRMFSSCRSLKKLEVSNFDTSNVTNMERMFEYCESLSYLDLSEFDTGNVTNMEGMFVWCNRLTNIDVSNFETQNLTNMRNMFWRVRKFGRNRCEQLRYK